MRTITSIALQRRRKRANVYLDGRFAFSLGLLAVEEAHLKQGQVLSDSQIQQLIEADLVHGAVDAALRYLSYRPRSEAELRGRLRRRGFDDRVVDEVVIRLKEQGLLDDRAFAQFWAENRASFSPRGRRLLRSELARKGVDPEIATETIEGLDEMASAYRAGQRKARTLVRAEYNSFRQRLGAFLQRRGFNYEVIASTVDRLWREQGVAKSFDGDALSLDNGG